MPTKIAEAEKAFLLVRGGERVLNIVKIPVGEAERFRADQMKKGVMPFLISENDFQAQQDVPEPKRKLIGAAITAAEYEDDVCENDNFNECHSFEEAVRAVTCVANKLTPLQMVYLLRVVADGIAEAANA
jgi:hypothetical protein